jgi:scytalone dehydratase
VGHERRDDIPASEYLEMMKSPMFLGDPLIRTQHLMGASRYERISDNEAVGHHQIRAAHQRYKPDGVTVENRGHGHSFVKHWYTKVDGEWKLSGLRPEVGSYLLKHFRPAVLLTSNQVYWNEHSFDKIFLKLNAKP